MTEQEYIYIKALGTISAAKEVLRDIVPENMKDIITKEEWSKVMPTLSLWQERLFEKSKEYGE